jgi:hypothetical protein
LSTLLELEQNLSTLLESENRKRGATTSSTSNSTVFCGRGAPSEERRKLSAGESRKYLPR